MTRALSLGTAAASVLVVLTALTACGGDGEPRVGGADPPAPAASPSSPEPPVESSGPSGSSEESSDSPSVAPADGPVLRTSDGVSIRVPRGFDGDPEGRPDQPRISERDSDLSSISFSTRQQIGERDFESFKQISRESRSSGAGFRVQPDRELLGEPAYHFTSTWSRYQRSDEFGVVLDGTVVSVRFVLLKTLTSAQRAEVVEPVLASLQVG